MISKARLNDAADKLSDVLTRAGFVSRAHGFYRGCYELGNVVMWVDPYPTCGWRVGVEVEGVPEIRACDGPSRIAELALMRVRRLEPAIDALEAVNVDETDEWNQSPLHRARAERNKFARNALNSLIEIVGGGS